MSYELKLQQCESWIYSLYVFCLEFYLVNLGYLAKFVSEKLGLH